MTAVLSNSINSPQQEEAGMIGDPGRLLHVVGDDHNGATAFELEDQVLDLRRSNGIERGAGPRRAGALQDPRLAKARAMQSRCCWPPERP